MHEPSINAHGHGSHLLRRMANAVEKVRSRARRVTGALDAAGVPYALVGGNAVAAWVASIDEAAVRATQDVGILLRRQDLERTRAALEKEGFVHRHAAGIDMFLDGPDARARDSVHIVFAQEKVRNDYIVPAPDVTEVNRADEGFLVLSLSALIRMKLTSFRDKDRMHLRDLIEVGLLGREHVAELPAQLGERLQQLLDNPEG